MHQSEPSGSWTALLPDTWLPASARSCAPPHATSMFGVFRLAPRRCALSGSVYRSTKIPCRATLVVESNKRAISQSETFILFPVLLRNDCAFGDPVCTSALYG